MKKKHIIKTLNMQDVEILTLDKADDRMEFEALPVFSNLEDCVFDCPCKDGTKCNQFCTRT